MPELTVLQILGPLAEEGVQGPSWISCPFGYSRFTHDPTPFPIDWVEKTGNMVWSATHEEGGHFAAAEVPEVLWGDVEACMDVGWGKDRKYHADE